MFTYQILVEYSGTKFFGWQKQSSEVSVQETIEENMSKIQSHKEVSIVGCGRTDTGVHAKEYFFHWDDQFGIDIKQMQYKLNKMLPESIAVHEVFNVKMDQHARFSVHAGE